MKIRHYFYLTLRITLLSGLLLGLFVAVMSAAIKWYFIPQLPPTSALKDVHLQEPLRIFTKDGLLMAEFGEQRRIPMGIHQVSPLLIKAIQAAEDDRFYDHPGVDPKSMVRALVSLIKTGERQQGGSTITMQVARNFFLSPERTYTRKFNEILLALKIENELGKEDILELYLNKIFFGHRAYGVGAAAQVYYNKEVKDLTLAEMAMLAGLPKAPSSNNPLSNPVRALDRRNYILRRMSELGYITEPQFDEAIESPNTAAQHNRKIEVDAPYVAEMVRAQLIDLIKQKLLRKNDSVTEEEAVYTNGYKVFTTIDSKLQEISQEALRNALYVYDERHGYRGPIAQINLPSPQKITKATYEVLQNYSVRGNLVPSLVLEVKSKSVVAYNQKAGQITIEWRDMAWAHRYKNDNRIGGAPASANNIVKRGSVILVRPILEEVKPTKNKQAKALKVATAGGNESATNEEEVAVKPKIRWRLAEVPQVEGALVALNPNDGAIVALSGGFDYYHSKFNRVTQAERQPGSNFKPFIYSAALDRGFNAASIINDAPIVFKVGNKVWRPANYSHKFYGPTTLRHALAFSRNVASVRLLSKVGVKPTIDHLVKFGFKREQIPKNLTIALGTPNLTPLELVTGYAVFANGGYKVQPYFIERIEDNNGNVVWSANPLQVCRTCPPEILAASLTEAEENSAIGSQSSTSGPPPSLASLGELCVPVPVALYAPQAIPSQNAYVMTSIMQDVIRIGTGQKAKELKRNDIAGKTGTTNDQKDAWFSGFNPDLVATAWVGFDHPRSLGYKETGGRAALPMWMEFMHGALAGQPEKLFAQPRGIVAVRINPLSGLRTRKENGVFESFAEESLPTPSKSRRFSNKPNKSSWSGEKRGGESSSSRYSSGSSSNRGSSSRNSGNSSSSSRNSSNSGNSSSSNSGNSRNSSNSGNSSSSRNSSNRNSSSGDNKPKSAPKKSSVVSDEQALF